MSAPAEALDVADLLAVQLGQLGPGEVERDADGDGAERHAPLGRQIEVRRSLRMPAAGELRAELGDDRLEPRALDLQPRSRIGAPKRFDSRNGRGLGAMAYENGSRRQGSYRAYGGASARPAASERLPPQQRRGLAGTWHRQYPALPVSDTAGV